MFNVGAFNVLFISFLALIFSFISTKTVYAETTPYRSAGWVATDGSTPYSNTTGCQASNDGLYCSRPVASSFANLYFGSFGNLENFGIPAGSYVTKLHIKVKGKSGIRQIIGVTAVKNKMPFSSVCQLPVDFWRFNPSSTDSITEIHTFTSDNGLINNCVNANNINEERLTFALSASSVSNWSADIDNFEIAFDYNPPGYPWQRKGDLIPRFDHSAALLSNGKVLVAGGERNGLAVLQAETYDPLTGNWTQVSSPNNTRRFNTTNSVITNTATGETKVLFAGGHELFGDDDLNTAELYNPTTNTWIYTPNLNSKRLFHASSLLNDGRVLITGGSISGSGGSINALSSTEIYDPISNTWTIQAPLNIARRYHTQVTFKDPQGNSKAMVMGGIGVSNNFLKSTEIYDSITNTWAFGPDMNFQRINFRAVTLNDGRILAVGTNIPNDITNDNTSEVYNPVANSWTVYNTAYPFRGGVITMLGSGAGYKILAVGGTGFASINAQLFDPDLNVWIITDSTNIPRGSGATLTTLNDGTVLAAGGLGALGQTRTSEIYTPPAVLGDSTGPAPFLDLPWDYQGQGKSFVQMALDPESWFDHEYPLQNVLCCVNTILPYTGIEKNDSYRSHAGYDYASKNGVEHLTPVLAAASGMAEFKPESKTGGLGNLIKIDHENGYQTWYGHLDTQGLIVSTENTEIPVVKGQEIGKTGYTGNIFPKNKFGAHIHFALFKDENENNTFADDYPFGLVDPLGWEGNSTDPWTEYGEDRHGAESFYLFLSKIKQSSTPIPQTGGSFTTDKIMVSVPNGALPLDFTIKFKYGPLESDDNLNSIVPSIFLSAFNALGDSITQFLQPIQITYDYGEADLFNINESTLKLYYLNEQNHEWTALPTINLDTNNNVITSETTHFSQFALMGEIKDKIAPTTEIILDGDQGKEGWYRTSVGVTLTPVDNAGGLGVKETLYSINGTDWFTYETPINFDHEGEHKITYQSIDNAGNLEDQKTETFYIDKTLPVVYINATPNLIWPPNEKMIDVLVTGDSTDEHLLETRIEVIDEYDLVEPTITDFDQIIQLKAARDGNDSDGRIYIIQAVAKDFAGNETTAKTTVIVPHNQ